MGLTTILTWRYVTATLFDVLNCAKDSCDSSTILGAVLMNSSSIWSRGTFEVLSDMGLIICLIIILNGYLYKCLPFSLVPNWIPFIGRADELLVTTNQVFAFLG